MKALRERRLIVIAAAVVGVVVVIGAVGALSSEPAMEAVSTAGEVGAGGVDKAGARPTSASASASDEAYSVGGFGRTEGAAAPASGAGSTAPPAPGPRIVKNGSVDVEVRERTFGRSFARLTTIATNLGGFVSSSKTFENDDVPNGTVTLRVPSDKFDELVRQVRGLGKVRAVSSSGEDVTAQFTDLRARLRALEVQRDQYLALMAKATSIPDTLAVRDRLNQVQTEIEQIQGQLKLLEDKTTFATLSVSIAEPGLPGVGPEPQRTGWSKAWHEAVDGFVRGAQTIVSHSGATLLVLLCMAAFGFVAWFGWRVVASRTSPANVAQEG